MDKILEEIAAERRRQQGLAFGGDTVAFDATNTQSDWVAFVAAYAGRAAGRVARNTREGQKFRDNMLKVAATCVAAIEAHDAGHC